MGDLWLLLFLPLSLAAFHGVKGCLECDPKFTEDIRSLLAKLIPSEVPGRIHLLERQIKEMIRLSFKVSHRDKMLRVLAVQKVTKLRTWLKNELYKLGNETFKGAFILQGKLLDVRQNLESKLKEILKNFSEVACSEDCVVIEGPVLDCWTCLRITSRCFRGEYCGEEDSRKAENREIALFLILLAEVVILGSALLLFYICVSHRRKMKAIRRSLKKYLEKKLEELMGMTDDKMDDFGIRK
ncbi:izumo sperm-egg fusion protein 3 isoform 1-T1 [Lycaon pictus]|uniref:IZUMO family member 3 n=3 Tax=Canis lupus TaxID=9612 RepID=A0A8C0Q2J6_CANLF|nr:izumo sperm-egg fusion protein 3 isoform X1 [Canis lupus familiaris]XP_025288905.1 izumo sperm-egg fusion protein 3 isoform X1 [Canis lupus dingo]XP_038407552.1 izumo sperm-egg fusion protein 3 isoform X1 [Canis lupus familiaris]XP_038536947.1 izumo sperm-egg fusion protein 3 isoform X1 [Canis lupus familiaris]|eukprot:XP_005626745.1 izumo sperm-egg fusion protein 3 isoform X1 [Canis lupus familiaris]